jgi:cytochrome c553
MRENIKSLIVTTGAGVMIAIGALAYASTASVTAAPNKRPTAQAQKLNRAQKLTQALKACKKDKSKSKRNRCEAAAHKKYGVKTGPGGAGPTSAGTTGTGTVAAGTGTAGTATTTTGTAGTTTGSGTTTGAATTTGGGTGGTTTGAGTTTGGGGTTSGGGKAAELEKAHQASNKPSTELVMKGKPLFAASCASCHGMEGHGETGIPETNLDETCGCGNPVWTLALTVAGVMEELIEPAAQTHVGLNFDQKFTLAEKEELGAWVCVEVTQKFSACQ